MTSHHNIRRPAVWLTFTCLAAMVFFYVTDPRSGIPQKVSDAFRSRDEPAPVVNVVDAAQQARLGTAVGLTGSAVLLLVSLFLCTRKGSPPTMEPVKAKKT